MKPLIALLFISTVAAADDAPPLAQIHDEQQLAEQIAQITNDPSVKIDDPAARAAATALMTEGVRRLQVQAYDQALANFLEAYNRFPSPKILLDIASTLHDMGRLADAANTYQRYLSDPQTGAERVKEVKELLLKLDAQLTILNVHVMPHGADVSIDGGPFVPVGTTLQTRIRPGTHTVRLRSGTATTDADINTFEAETRELSLEVKEVAPPPVATKPPEIVNGWLVDRSYVTSDGNSRERRVQSVATHTEVKPYVPGNELDYQPPPPVEEEEHLSSGVIAMARIDGNHWKGFAGGAGIAYAANDHFEVELAILKSDVYGAYAGARYLVFTGIFRPYVGAGLPLFFFTADDNSNHVSVGGRIAAGLEIRINGHLSVQGDLGVEHFFNVDGVVYKMQTFEATTFAPTIGVIGRL
ncbi:MAG: hypothetical protein QM831_25710 [Kofleriaceae bacterium]